MPRRYLHIELGSDRYSLDFLVADTPLADLWIDRMQHRDPYPLDHPDRFYNFSPRADEIARAEDMVKKCVNIINAHQPIIERPFTNARDQDCLNYLHSIFERYHGLLDQQDHDFWQDAPTEVRTALAELNLAVHRCETAVGEPNPRFVCTWFGMPKTMILPDDIMSRYGVLNPRFGSVCLNYCEIGKTLEDLAQDNDDYIGTDAFKPFGHYSADFVVRLFEQAPDKVQANLDRMCAYFNNHRSFFRDRRFLQFNHVKLLPLRFPVAVLIERTDRNQIIQDITQRQHVARVYIDETMHHSHTR